MFRRNNPVSGLQRPESSDNTLAQQPAATNELPLRPAAAPAQTLAPRPVAATTTAPAGKPADLPVSRFGGIPGVMPRRVGAAAETATQQGTAAAADQQGLRKLIVGREITLSGDITTCDILMVEGNIDATLRDGKVLEITQEGHFRGAAEVDEADIAGKFEGNLTVRGRLRLRATGQIEGTLSYGEIEVEAGGRLIGELKVLTATPQKTTRSKREESSAEPAARLTTGAEA
jgi:cytoskeletal protein CcmA (bactofilin family)